jgi:hypothetical protein
MKVAMGLVALPPAGRTMGAPGSDSAGLVIDDHQHTDYFGGLAWPIPKGRSNEEPVLHRRYIYDDVPAGLGLNALLRDENYTREFLKRFQNRLTFGSDCWDTIGHGPRCTGWKIIRTIRRLASEPAVAEKILHGNTERIHKGLLKI